MGFLTHFLTTLSSVSKAAVNAFFWGENETKYSFAEQSLELCLPACYANIARPTFDEKNI